MKSSLRLRLLSTTGSMWMVSATTWLSFRLADAEARGCEDFSILADWFSIIYHRRWDVVFATRRTIPMKTVLQWRSLQHFISRAHGLWEFSFPRCIDRAAQIQLLKYHYHSSTKEIKLLALPISDLYIRSCSKLLCLLGTLNR